MCHCGGLVRVAVGSSISAFGVVVRQSAYRRSRIALEAVVVVVAGGAVCACAPLAGCRAPSEPLARSLAFGRRCVEWFGLAEAGRA